jgi:uncharacterized membrane protein
MRTSIKLLSAALVMALGLGIASAAALAPAASSVGYVASVSTTDACKGIQALDSTATCGPGDTTGTSTVDNLITTVVNILSWVVGVAAVIAIVFSGFKYVTSGGDSNKTSAAKTTLIYALVGLIVVVLAQFIVHFTLNQATSAANDTCATNSSLAANSPHCQQ